MAHGKEYRPVGRCEINHALVYWRRITPLHRRLPASGSMSDRIFGMSNNGGSCSNNNNNNTVLRSRGSCNQLALAFPRDQRGEHRGEDRAGGGYKNRGMAGGLQDRARSILRWKLEAAQRSAAQPRPSDR